MACQRVTIVIRGLRAITGALLSVTTATLQVGEERTLTATVNQPVGAPTATIQWSTSNAAVATVDAQGRVRALAPGNVNIMHQATSPAGSGYAADTLRTQAIIAVAVPLPSITQLTVSPSTATFNMPDSVRLTANVTKASAGIQPRITYASSQPSIAVVDSLGVVSGVAGGTATITVTASAQASIGYSAVTLMSAATVVVVRRNGLTSLAVQPATYAFAVGQSSPLVHNVTQPAGAPAATVSLTSSAPQVATVANGVVTAVAPGTAVITVTATTPNSVNFAATTLTQLVPVTVTLPSLQLLDVRQGPTTSAAIDSSTAFGSIRGLSVRPNPQSGLPLDITNVRDDVIAVVNASFVFDSIALTLTDANGSNRVALDVRRGTIAVGMHTLQGNTSDFSVDAVAGIATVRVTNGSRRLQFVGWYQGAGGVPQTVSSTSVPVQINNVDGFALHLVPPTRSALDNGGRAWVGGDGANGVGTITVIPVFYTAGRSVTSLSIAFGRCPTVAVRTFAPFRATFGSATSGAAINCGGISGSTDAADSFRAEDYPMVTSSSDNLAGAGSGPSVTYVYDPGGGAHPWAGPRPSLWRQSSTYTSPLAIRVDYSGIIIPP